MTTERQKAKNLKLLRTQYGFDLPALMEAVYRLGFLQGQCDEAFRRWDQMSLDPRWREQWLRGRVDDLLLANRKAFVGGHAMAHFLMDEHIAERPADRPIRQDARRQSKRPPLKVTPLRDAERARKRKK